MNDTNAAPSIGEIAAIVALESQPILRNLKITQCYHDVSRAIGALAGEDNLNWCTFATWASKTAGRFIRIDEILPVFRSALAGLKSVAARIESINRTLALVNPAATVSVSTAFQALESPLAEVSRQVAAGNLAVFAELAPMFSRLCSRLAGATRYDADGVLQLLRELALKDGMPAEGGQSYLKSAVQYYYCAKFETAADRKAEWLLLANAQTGLHEQIRLQPAIAGSLGLPFGKALRLLYEKHHDAKFVGPLRSRLRRVVESLGAPLFAEIDTEVNQVWRKTATRAFMTLQLAGGEIHLGKDLRPNAGEPLFPPALRTIEHAPLQQLLAFYHADGAGSAGSAAVDWADIPERMQFILTLFRSRQQDAKLFDPPFSFDQRKALAAGQVPSGRL
jgi:hypothetical protein